MTFCVNTLKIRKAKSVTWLCGSALLNLGLRLYIYYDFVCWENRRAPLICNTKNSKNLSISAKFLHDCAVYKLVNTKYIDFESFNPIFMLRIKI